MNCPIFADVASVVGVLKDVMLALAAVTGAFCAIKGLGTWHRQLAGGADHEIARRLLLATYRLREAVRRARFPWMSKREKPKGLVESHEPSVGGIPDPDWTVTAWEARLEGVLEAHTELDAALLEAEALWGTKVRDKFHDTVHKAQDLVDAINGQIASKSTNVDPSWKEYLNDKAQKSERRDILFASPDDDCWNREFLSSLESVEVYVRNHFRRPT